MLDNVAKQLSIAAAALLCLSALFNIGYFYAVGFHFVGLMDLTNVIYSFGIAILYVVVLAMGVTLSWFAYTTFYGDEGMNERQSWSAFTVSTIVGSTASLSIVFFDFSKSLFWLAGLLTTIAASLVFMALLSKNNNANRNVAALCVAIFFVSAGVLALGAAVGRREAFTTPTTYDVVTKSGAYSGARLLRTSSSGFLFSHEGRVFFIPSSEVRLVSSPIS